MLSKLHDRLGTAGLAIAVVALVFAMAGGAWAASGGLTGQQKKEVKKIAQTEAKKFATAGAPGAAGPQGPAGKDGTSGNPGSPGSPGGAGATGPTGKNGVTGVTGVAGTTGPTGPFMAHLETEKTETGTWIMGSSSVPASMSLFTAISFPIPLSAALAGSGPSGQIHIVNAAGEEYDPTEGVEALVPSTKCTGSVANPTAEKGNLCVYFRPMEGMAIGFATTGPEVLQSNLLTIGAETTGAFLQVTKSGTEGLGRANGSFAVTGS